MVHRIVCFFLFLRVKYFSIKMPLQPSPEQPGKEQPGPEWPGLEQLGPEQPGREQPGLEQQQPSLEQPGQEQQWPDQEQLVVERTRATEARPEASRPGTVHSSPAPSPRLPLRHGWKLLRELEGLLNQVMKD
uniref:Uncharacterized protein n=1 Tax=Pipistrellus kuhlii TaxID=59472 RepID=A0A7J7S0R3_PIPKU|nr:hypothetical protein mPipKuh1_010194 [Pipistrellus kuhlii]